MRDDYPWAENENKLGRALLEVTNEMKAGAVKPEDFEKAVKERYIKFAGVVLDIERKDRKPATEDEAEEAPRASRGRKPATKDEE